MTLVDIVTEYLAVIAKLNLKVVPFGGISQCVAPLLGGKVDAIVNSGLQEFVKAGKMRYIARMTEGETKEFKDIPHIKEFGYDINAAGFAGIFAPKGVPEHILKKLEEVFNRAVRDPSVIEAIENYGDAPAYRNSKDFANFIKKERERARKMMKELGVGIFAKEKK